MPAGTETIYVALVDEPPGTWRPVEAAARAGGLYFILSKNDDPESEQWQFPSGGLVRCEPRQLDGQQFLLAVELVAPQALRPVRK
jgi:hypothetical protein